MASYSQLCIIFATIGEEERRSNILHKLDVFLSNLRPQHRHHPLVLLWFVVTVAIVTGGFLTVCLVFERFTIGRPTVEHTMQIFLPAIASLALLEKWL